MTEIFLLKVCALCRAIHVLISVPTDKLGQVGVSSTIVYNYCPVFRNHYQSWLCIIWQKRN